mmetsp:Transcript_71532/g.190241  ORF Transcript_71532/g.190241 Transcript_71532/m.190241 type:complete len:423 (-) Transcript_71532:202-1470(-)|eukprot:CAMPEP_0171179344 /NCGR_PEP_ID=MMETSP0790-20130122/13209_1 /TAXON_ID=2925 /ORGANISM="Alexandrium catenella, Strain OF101" /LENGTH=422 /DNA_ID=CAMNT_0011644275 /DNA_START=101 /DNA_END=1369 /DNA_ORIENTATION=-
MASMMQAQHELRRTSSRLGRGPSPRELAPSPTGSSGAETKQQAGGPTSDLQGFANIFGQHKLLSLLLLSVPVGFASHYLEWDSQYVFLFNFLAIIPLAWLIGKATEDVAAKVGETAGGLLNATFGNVVEMLLCIAGIRKNEVIVVQCTLLGSILSNLLLVMGCAFLAGGLFYPVQRFNQAGAATQCSLMAMSVFAIGLPTIYANILHQETEWEHMVQVSRWASIFLLGVYMCYLVFQLKTHSELFQDEGGEEEEEEGPDLSAPTAAVLLGCATVVTSFATDFLIDALEGTLDTWDVSKEFIGIIVLPIIGNAAEHYTAITVAMRNKMDLSLGVAAGSSCQMALLVTPFTVLVGWAVGTEMTLNFHAFQLAVLMFAVFLVTTILNNGQSNWLEGVILLVTYSVVSLIYFCEGRGKDASLATLA